VVLEDVVASLRSWFDADRRPENFYLTAIEVVSTADARLVRVVVDW